MSLPRHPLRIALVQHAATEDRAANFVRLRSLVDAPPGDVDLLLLPEIFSCRGGRDTLKAHAEPVEGPSGEFLAAMARRRNCWTGGGIVEREGGRVFNTLLLYDRSGALAARYRKRHLFSARLENGVVIEERGTFEAGASTVVADIEGWRCGLSICFDLRFPSLYQELREMGADVLLAPSNFTQRTGRDHWHLLARARAVETQCFLLAPNQCGLCPETGVASYGHSLAIGPWGEVLADAGEGEGLVRAVLDPAALAQARTRIVLA